jgi:hypothetical protein
MQLRAETSQEDLIQRCSVCEHCIFEEILSAEQRKVKVLSLRIPDYHVHRITIEQICGRHYDEVCRMKYAAMRALCDDRTAMQMGVIKNFVWDLGKVRKKAVDYSEACLDWTRDQDLGRGVEESYATRFGEVWRRGIRAVGSNGGTIKKQILTADQIYEIVMARPETYEKALGLLDALVREHKERDAR